MCCTCNHQSKAYKFVGAWLHRCVRALRGARAPLAPPAACGAATAPWTKHKNGYPLEAGRAGRRRSSRAPKCTATASPYRSGRRPEARAPPASRQSLRRPLPLSLSFSRASAPPPREGSCPSAMHRQHMHTHASWQRSGTSAPARQSACCALSFSTPRFSCVKGESTRARRPARLIILICLPR